MERRLFCKSIITWPIQSKLEFIVDVGWTSWIVVRSVLGCFFILFILYFIITLYIIFIYFSLFFLYYYLSLFMYLSFSNFITRLKKKIWKKKQQLIVLYWINPLWTLLCYLSQRKTSKSPAYCNWIPRRVSSFRNRWFHHLSLFIYFLIY